MFAAAIYLPWYTLTPSCVLISSGRFFYGANEVIEREFKGEKKR